MEKPDKLSLKIKKLLEKSRAHRSAKIENNEHQTQQEEELIESNRGLRVYKISNVENQQRNKITVRKQIINITEHFNTVQSHNSKYY